MAGAVMAGEAMWISGHKTICGQIQLKGKPEWDPTVVGVGGSGGL